MGKYTVKKHGRLWYVYEGPAKVSYGHSNRFQALRTKSSFEDIESRRRLAPQNTYGANGAYRGKD